MPSSKKHEIALIGVKAYSSTLMLTSAQANFPGFSFTTLSGLFRIKLSR